MTTIEYATLIWDAEGQVQLAEAFVQIAKHIQNTPPRDQPGVYNFTLNGYEYEVVVKPEGYTIEQPSTPMRGDEDTSTWRQEEHSQSERVEPIDKPQGGEYICPTCRRHFPTEHGLLVHERRMHKTHEAA